LCTGAYTPSSVGPSSSILPDPHTTALHTHNGRVPDILGPRDTASRRRTTVSASCFPTVTPAGTATHLPPEARSPNRASSPPSASPHTRPSHAHTLSHTRQLLSTRVGRCPPSARAQLKRQRSVLRAPHSQGTTQRFPRRAGPRAHRDDETVIPAGYMV